MSLIDRSSEIGTSGTTPEVVGSGDLFTRTNRNSDPTKFPVFGATLLDFYDDEVEQAENVPPYNTTYRLVRNFPSVVVEFDNSVKGREAFLAFQLGCFDSEGKRRLYPEQLLEDHQNNDETTGGVVCFSFSATDLSVEQIITLGYQRKVETRPHLRVA